MLIVPEKLKPYNFDILSIFLSTLTSMVDIEDYNHFTSQIAKNFYMQNKLYLGNLSKIGNEDIGLIWENLNVFFSLSNLGKSQMIIDLENRSISIRHYDSLFVKYLHDKANFKLCNFYAELYSLVLTDIFERSIKVVEKECNSRSGKEFCLFTASW
jgi:predicted hydrocarbon binding protein